MIITIASGKGGTGKTTLATNLALSFEDRVRLLDCDVEEPNCHIFLKPEIKSTESIGIPVPSVDEQKCTACGKCGQVCQYSAIVSLKTKPLIFPELCHGCGGCALLCPTAAICEVNREIGVLEKGQAANIEFIQGRLKIGEAMSPPLIRAIKSYIKKDGLTIIDAPPGSSCPVVETVKGSDYVVLVTEPTPFGLNDLILAAEMVRQLGIPWGVVVNRSGIGDDRVTSYCREKGFQLLYEIPDDRRIAEAYSRGQAAVKTLPSLKNMFSELYSLIEKQAIMNHLKSVAS